MAVTVFFILKRFCVDKFGFPKKAKLIAFYQHQPIPKKTYGTNNLGYFYIH